MNKVNSSVTFRLEDETKDALIAAAAKLERKPSDVVRLAVKKYLKEMKEETK